MATAVIIVRDPNYGRRCEEAFRAAGLIPVVVESPARALTLLTQFQASVIVVEREAERPTDWEPLVSDLAAGRPLLTYSQLPPPPVLASEVRHALGAAGQQVVEADG